MIRERFQLTPHQARVGTVASRPPGKFSAGAQTCEPAPVMAVSWLGGYRVRAANIVGVLILSVPACGGVAAGDKPTSGSQPPDSASAGGAGAPSDMLPEDKIQLVDDVDHAGQPATPAHSSAFFWRGGLGNWFVSTSDGLATRDATTDDVIPPRGENTKAYHVAEMNAGTAVDLWAQLNHPQGTGADLGSYSGIAFWARLNSSSGELTIAFGADGRFADVTSAPHKVVPLSQNWTQFVVRFDELGVNATAVSSIDFVVGQAAPFELWVDDLALLCRSDCP